ncbi:hypothetical protein ACPV47_17915, partial [Vibrio jasicida]|uniref:hypothetical protein n=1 Tax=Vibrio jasicida TaxID=766224 RepID=UPI0040689C5F
RRRIRHHRGEAKFVSASPTVEFEGKDVCRLSDQMTISFEELMLRITRILMFIKNGNKRCM